MTKFFGLSALLVIVCLFSVTLCGSPAPLPNTFDFIIVGSGAAGSVLASRLANETSKTVLLLEAGEQGTGQQALGGTDYVASQFVTNPVTGVQRLGTPWTRYDSPAFVDTIRDASTTLNNMWNITPVGPFNQQARIIGGNMASNGMAWILPFKINFDNWHVSGWSGDFVWNYFKSIENATLTGLTNHTARGFSGPITVSSGGVEDTPSYEFLNATMASGYTTYADVNNGEVNPSGIITTGQTNILNGIRQSTSLVYLSRVLGRKPNLTFRTNTTVTRVLFNAAKVAIGVEYVDSTGELQTAYANLEVVLAAGVLLIPQILYNSGIGPSSILNAFGKPHIYVNELIGQKIRVQQTYSLKFNEPSKINPSILTLPLQSIAYASTGTGWLASRGGNGLQVRVNPAHPHNDIDLGSGGGVGTSTADVYSQSITISISLSYNLAANSTLNLTSSDPLAGTIFTTNLFLVQEDVDTAVAAVGVARTLASHWPVPIYETFPGPAVNTSAAIAASIRANGSTNCHYHGSVPMGDSSTWPVDPRLNLRGVSHLRIVGPAVAPNYIARGMQAMAVVFGEIGTDFIKQDHHL